MMIMDRYVSRTCQGCLGHGTTVASDGVKLLECPHCRGVGVLTLPVPEGSITQKMRKKPDARLQACYAATQLILNRGGGWKAAVRGVLQIADEMRDET